MGRGEYYNSKITHGDECTVQSLNQKHPILKEYLATKNCKVFLVHTLQLLKI